MSSKIIADNITGGNSTDYVQNDANGIKLVGNANKIISSNGTNALTVLNNGNVGIGTTNPLNKLDIIADASKSGLYVENQGNVNYPTALFKNNQSSIYSYASIDIYGGSAITNLNKFQFGQYATGDAFFYLAGNNNLDFFTNGNNRMRITGAGNVGIGTTSPDSLLQVQFTTAFTDRVKFGGAIFTKHSSTGYTGLWMGSGAPSITNYSLISDASGDTILNSISKILFAISDSVKMIIQNSGNVCINTATDNGTDKLQVNGSSLATTAKGGTTTDYTQNDANGIHLFGSATQFDDLSAGAMTLQQTGPGVSLNIPECSVDFTSDSNLSDYVVQSIQLSHAWKLNSIIFPHIHFVQTTNAVPNFLLQYRWQIDGGATKTDWTNLICNIAAFAYSSGSLNQIAHTSAGITPPSGAMLSDGVEFRVIRDNANTSGLFAGTDPVNATVSIKYFDIHIQKDSIGSNTEYSKD
jgi:hypothetical protein